MDYRKIAEEIVMYFSKTRAVGHTYLSIKGLKNTDPSIMITNDTMSSVDIGTTYEISDKSKFITLNQILDGQLRGRNVPITFDNAALYLIISKLLTHIDNLELKLTECEYKLSKEIKLTDQIKDLLQ